MILVLIFVLALLAGGDIATTVYGLRHGCDEANPFFTRLFRRLQGIPLIAAMAALKLFGLALFALLLIEAPAYWPAAAVYAASLVLVIRSNLAAIRSAATPST